MYAQDIRDYAELIVSMVGIDTGRRLEVRGEPVHWDLITEVAAAAYRRGAQYVRVQSEHPGLYKARVENSAEEYLDYVPKQLTLNNDVIIEEGWSLVAIKSPEDPDFFADIDTERNARMSQAVEQAVMPLRRALQADRFPWLVVAAPTEKWGKKVLDSAGPVADSGATTGAGPAADSEGSTGAGPAADSEGATGAGPARDRLWAAMKPILRLDHDDPVGAWTEHSRRLKERAARLDELAVASLHFEGPGTDLWVGIPETALWVGGPAHTPGGVEFLPNLPTEEIFTAPDYRLTSGYVTVTRPVTVMDKIVEGAWFEFCDGKVVEFDATKNRDLLGEYLEMDEGAAYAGEIALVDAASPIFQAGHVFYNILFDENAACHIALGGSYPGCLEGGDQLSDEEVAAVGGNVSFVHTDFMIGSESIHVTARTRDGGEQAILRAGRFVM
ncbi:MAG: aminopeptidase [Spirochaetia bacterium]